MADLDRTEPTHLQSPVATMVICVLMLQAAVGVTSGVLATNGVIEIARDSALEALRMLATTAVANTLALNVLMICRSRWLGRALVALWVCILGMAIIGGSAALCWVSAVDILLIAVALSAQETAARAMSNRRP